MAERRPWWQDARVWLIAGALVGVFVLDLVAPQAGLLPFLLVPVIGAAAFAGPRVTLGVAALAWVLGLAAGRITGRTADSTFWYRLVVLVAVSALAVLLAHVTESGQRRLVEVQEQRRLMLDHITDVIWLRRPDLSLVWVSPSLHSVFGYEPDEVLGTAFMLTQADGRQELAAAYARAVAEGRDRVRSTVRVRCADGSPAWVEESARLMWGADGTLESVVSSTRDVTAQVVAQQALASAKERFQLLAENASDVVYSADVESVLEWVSPSVTELLGWRPEQLEGRPIAELLHPDDLSVMAETQRVLERGDRRSTEVRLRTESGGHRWLSAHVRAVRDPAGAVIGRIGSLRDAEAEVTGRRALALSEERFRLAMASAPTGMAVVGLDLRFLEVNPALCRLLGREPEWLYEHRVTDVLDREAAEADGRLREQALSGSEPSVTGELHLVRPDGERVWMEHSIGVLRDESGAAMSYVSQFVDVTERRLAREALLFTSAHDPLTLLLNRGELHRRMERILSHPQRTGTVLAVLFVDLDGLKAVNDSYGHSAGDRLIIDASDRILAEVRADDLVARLGGDEFIVVLPAVNGVDDASIVAAKVRRAIAVPFETDGGQISVTVSIGIALSDPGDTPGHVLRRADLALYRAKRSGRDRAVSYERDIDEAPARADVGEPADG